MKFEISRVALQDALSYLVEFKRKGTEQGKDKDGNDIEVPVVISEVRLDVVGNKLTLYAVGTAMAATREVGTIGECNGELPTVVVDSVAFFNIVKKASLGKVLVCEMGESGLSISSQRENSKFILDLRDAGKFPAYKIETEGNLPEINALLLRRLISNVAFAAGKRRDPINLQGVHIHGRGDQLISVAMNGPRLARYAVERPYDLVEEESLTIPNISVPYVLSFLEEAGDLFTVKLYADDNKLVLISRGGQFVTCLVDAKFPDYERILGTGEYQHTIDFDEFTFALDCCSSVADKFAIIRNVDGEEGVAVEAWHPIKGSAQCFIEVEGPNLPTHIGFDIKYMMEAIGGGREVKVDFGDGVKPIRIRGENDTEFYAVISPMRVGLPVGAVT